MPSLIVRDGPLAGTTITVDEAVLVGRADGDLVIDDPGVSRLHARIEPVDGGLQVTDLGSSNGTWVNGVRIEAVTALKDGDVVLVGKTSIDVKLEPAAQPTKVHEAPATGGATKVSEIPVPRSDATAMRPKPTPPAAAAPAPAPAKVAAASAAGGAGGGAALRPFEPPPARRRRAVATRMPLPTILTFVIILATGGGLIAYFSITKNAAVKNSNASTQAAAAVASGSSEPCTTSLPTKAGTGHFQFNTSLCENPDSTIATIPLQRGTSHGKTVYYVVMDSSSQADATARKINFAPKLANAKGSTGVMVVKVVNGVVDFPATVDFSHRRTIQAGPTGFPPAKAVPGGMGEATYSPLIEMPDGTVVNAPQISNSSGNADKVLSIDTNAMKVRYQMTEGRYEDKHVHYASFDSSSPVAAAIEDMTYAPALSAIPSLGDEDQKTSAREGLIAFVNGPTGKNNPNRQGLSSTLLDNEDPHNILHETPALPLHSDIGSTAYDPMWDVRFAEWTTDAVNNGDRSELRSFDEVMTRVDTMDPTMPDLITGFMGAKFGPVGIIVNCPLISIDVP